MNYRQPTLEELFESTYSKKLLDIQSTHFVNNSLAKGGITEGFEGMPLSIPQPELFENEVIKNKITQSLLETYIKNNWKALLTCLIVGGVLTIGIIHVFNKHQKKNTKKPI